MASEGSAYTVLGLEPGADWTAVEGAYRALMKLHHPDRPGGDAERATEINRAYRELRQARTSDPWLGFDDMFEGPPQSRRWLAAVLGIATVVGLLLLLTTAVTGLVGDFRMRAAPAGATSSRRALAAAPSDPMTKPLDDASIRHAISEAIVAAGSRDDAATLEQSRKCHRALHLAPSISQLDACAAFDDAIVQLRDRDPLRDDGEFGQVAVTGREVSAGSLLSDDYLAIEGRLDRIRLEVELALSRSQRVPRVGGAG